LFDRAVAASLRGEDAGKQLTKYLGDAHAIEKQAAKLLEKAPEMAGAEELADVFAEHLEQTKRHGELVAARLEARGAGPSALKDTALRLGALNIGMFLKAQPDVPAKLAAFAYAFEHLEIASYEMLRRVALQAEDSDTAAVAGEILVQEQAAAGLLHDLLGTALDAAVEEAVTEA
jgi:ferritin-like metal-binding protein YciE